MRFVATYGDLLVGADLAEAVSLAIPLHFNGPQPNAFGMTPAHAQAARTGDFIGDTRAGGSVNCETLTLSPHCNGTHTECIGHLTQERIAVHDVLLGGLWLALVVSVTSTLATQTTESSDLQCRPEDQLITAQALATAVQETLQSLGNPSLPLTALVVRTLPNSPDKLCQSYALEPSPAYFTGAAASWLVNQNIQHVIIDLPSLDRSCDAGELTAHRQFWGVAPGSAMAGPQSRRHCTITELAFIAPSVSDGLYLLDLQIPAFVSDAAPARPLLYPASLI